MLKSEIPLKKTREVHRAEKLSEEILMEVTQAFKLIEKLTKPPLMN